MSGNGAPWDQIRSAARAVLESTMSLCLLGFSWAHLDFDGSVRRYLDRDAVRAIYNRTTYWRARAEMMQAWSDRLDALREGEFTLLLAA